MPLACFNPSVLGANALRFRRITNLGGYKCRSRGVCDSNPQIIPGSNSYQLGPDNYKSEWPNKF